MAIEKASDAECQTNLEGDSISSPSNLSLGSTVARIGSRSWRFGCGDTVNLIDVTSIQPKEDWNGH